MLRDFHALVSAAETKDATYRKQAAKNCRSDMMVKKAIFTVIVAADYCIDVPKEDS